MPHHGDKGHDQRRVDRQVQRQRRRDHRAGHGGGGLGRLQQPEHQVGLAADLGDVPAGQRGQPAGEAHAGQAPQQRAGQGTGVPAAALQQPPAGPGEGQHQHAGADHDAKAPEHRRHRRVRALELVQAADLAVQLMRQDQAGELGDRDLEVVAACGLVGPGEQQQRRALFRLPHPFHRRHLLRLVLQRVQAVQVTGDDLQRDQHRTQRQAGAQRLAGPGLRLAAQHLPGGHTGQQKGHRQPRGQQHMHQPVRERGVEDDLRPRGGKELAVADLEAGRRVHPRVQRQDPERAHRGAEGHQEGGDQVHPLADAAMAEQHDAQEAGLQEKRRQHLVAQQRAGDVAHALHEARPVGAELEAHHDAADHTECKAQRKHLGPEAVGAQPGHVLGLQPAPAEEQQRPAECDGDGGEQDVEADVGRELHAGEHEGVHGSDLSARDDADLAGELQQALHLGAHLHQLRQRLAVQALHVVEPRGHQLDQVVHALHALLRDAVGFVARRFQQRIAQQRQRGFDLAPAALFGQGLEDLPGVLRRLEVLAPVTGHMAQRHQAPGLQFLQPHADVAAAELQRLGDLLGVQRRGRDEDQRVDLAHGAVDAPAAAHLAKMADEAAHQRCEGVHAGLQSSDER